MVNDTKVPPGAWTSMGPNKNSSFLGHDSFLMGAIFMSNQTTKEECFREKLFGLPSSHEDFIKKIKAGMTLFLFEYEERKLYGVFEATSDGAMDIIPTAFISSGKLFPAQVCFRRIWYCHPLTEDEFYDAIEENYYAHNKFHFHLSEAQVYKLLHLFNSKRSNNQQHCIRGGKFISQSRHPRKNSVKKYENFRSGTYELNTKGKAGLNMYLDSPGTNFDRSAYHKKSLWNAENAVVGPECALYSMVSLVEQSELPDVVNSTSGDVHAFRRNIPVSFQDISLYQLVPGLHVKKSSTYSGTDNASLNEQTYSRGLVDGHTFPGSQCYHSDLDQKSVCAPRVYENVGAPPYRQGAAYPVYESSSCRLPALASKDLRDRSNFTNLQDSTARDFRSRVCIANPQNSTDPLSQRFYDLHTPEIFPPSHGNYTNWHRDVITSGHCSSGTQLLPYAHCASTSQHDDNSRGHRYFRLEPDEIFPHLEYEPSDMEIIESTFCGSPEKASSPMLYVSGPSEYQDESSHSYHAIQDDEYDPAAANFKFHSDVREKRASVFSRLSGLEKASSVETFETCEPDFDISLDELIKSLSSRRKSWIKMKQIPKFKNPTEDPDSKKMELTLGFRSVYKVPDQFVMLDDADHLEKADQLEPHATNLCSCSEEETQNNSIPPFLNFKRRSESQRVADEAETVNSVEPGESGMSLAKRKRRKLIRPSFGEEDASKKDVQVQIVVGTTEEEFRKVNDGESESVDSALGIGNSKHSAAKSGCDAGGTSQDHPMDRALSTAGEHLGNVGSASQSDVTKPMELNSEDTTFVKGQSKSQDMLESCQNLHGGPALVIAGNSSGCGECNDNRGKVEMTILSLSLHNGNAKTNDTGIAAGGRYLSRIGESNGGVEHGGASERNVGGSERRHGVEFSGECRVCSCNLEGLSKGHQPSVRAAQDIGTGELSSNQCIACAEEENIRIRVHSTEFNSKNARYPHRNLVSTANVHEENIYVKEHFTEFDSGSTNDSQRNMVSTAMGGQVSSSSCVFYSGKPIRDTEEEIAVSETKPDLDGNYKKTSQGISIEESAEVTTVKSCGKRHLCEVVGNEIKTSRQHLVCSPVDMAMGGSLSKPCTVQSGNASANTKERVCVSKCVCSGEQLSNPVVKTFEKAVDNEQTAKLGVDCTIAHRKL